VKKTFERELTVLMNQHGIDTETNTPDYILAEYLTACLTHYSEVTKKRDKWFHPDPEGG